MADSLELVGVKGVRKQTGTEMSIIRPLRGGDTHQVKEWWRKECEYNVRYLYYL